MTESTNLVAEGFTDTAADYEDAVRFNIGGAQRLIMSIPPGRYDDVLDVGCGTGWATQAVIDRFHPARVTGVDPSEGMLDEFMAKVGGIEGTEISLAQGDVENMPVPDGAFDLVICSMAYHWFPRKWDAAKAMARTLKPGGVMAILCSGRGGDQAYREILANLEPPNYVWLGTFDAVQRDIPEMEDYLLQAGLEVDDVWMERRVRHTTVDAYMERMRVVAGHLIGDPSDADVKAYMDRIEQAMRDASGPRGFTYDFTKLYAIARKP
jgi:ubiquinone/menaquinone biosynthesis C-methylase UbiE